MNIKAIAFCYLAVILNGCGYFETDNDIIYERKIFKNIELFRNGSMEDVSLMSSDGKQSMFSIVEVCKTVYSDSMNKKVYVEKYINEYNSSFFEVNILEPKKLNPLNTFQKKEISKGLFDSLSRKAILIYEKK
jgi:hypothetical protein